MVALCAGVPAGESTPWSRHPHDAAGTSTSTVRTRGPARDAGSHGLKMLFSVQHHDPAQYPFGLCSTCSCSNTRAARPYELKDTLRPEAPVSSTVKVPALCPREEWRLHHSPSVVAGGSSDDALLNTNTSRCTVGNCTHLWDSLSNVHQSPGRARCAGRRRAQRGSDIAISPRPPKGSGALANFRLSQ